MPTTIEIVSSTVLWAAIATLCVVIPGVPLAYSLARIQGKTTRLITTLFSMPMVLPPTAVGFLLLKLLADDGILGRDTLGFDPNILFTWKAVVLACSIMATPLVVRTMKLSFESIDPQLEAMAYTLGYSRTKTFFAVTLPLAWKGLLAAGILGFARSLGEFGATVMIAGNIPGQTQTLASAIFNAQQSGEDERGIVLVLVSLTVGFITIIAAESLNRSSSKAGHRR